MARNWFRDDNFTFLIVFFEVKSKGLMVSWMVTQQAEALDKGNSRRPAAMVKRLHLAEGVMDAELQAVLAPLKSRATMIGMVKFRNTKLNYSGC
jgi:hypothetical protein